MLPKDNKKKDAGKLAKKDKDPVNKSGAKLRSDPREKCETSSTIWFCLTKQHMTNCKEVPSYKLITPTVVSERLKIWGSLAQAALQELLSKRLIKLVSKHRAQVIYTKSTKGGDAPAAEDA